MKEMKQYNSLEEVLEVYCPNYLKEFKEGHLLESLNGKSERRPYQLSLID